MREWYKNNLIELVANILEDIKKAPCFPINRLEGMVRNFREDFHLWMQHNNEALSSIKNFWSTPKEQATLPSHTFDKCEDWFKAYLDMWEWKDKVVGMAKERDNWLYRFYSKKVKSDWVLPSRITAV